ncbi:MAG TPA: glycosyltransferase family 1 protein [Solirubrobacteraceae bacterium]|jgi:glycosyltransferase involved in cell wall biosynthesis
MKPLTIGIDARAAAEVPAGRGRVVRELLRELAAREDAGCRYLLYARRQWDGVPLDERFGWRLIDARDPWWHLKTALAANRACDVFLSSNSYLTVWFLRIPAVPIVYDMIPFEPQMLPNRRSAAIERITLGKAVRRSAALLCISEATASALVDRFSAAAGRIVVAPLGATLAPLDELDPDEATRLPSAGFVLAVGTLEPRKNLPRLVAAYSRLDQDVQADHPLVVVGPSGWEMGETFAALRSLGERSRILGYVSEAALAELYRRCAVFCYPSLGEGFGLPVLEAMTAGAAVITSNVSSLPEVGGDAVAYVDPRDTESIAVALGDLLHDPQARAELGDRARLAAASFSWARFAAATAEALTNAAR